jgi:hypothetical protein
VSFVPDDWFRVFYIFLHTIDAVPESESLQLSVKVDIVLDLTLE